MTNSIELNDFNTSVVVTMLDTKTGKIEVREISGSNLMYSENNKWIVFEEKEQEKQLLNWIKTRANKQHETRLELISWALIVEDDNGNFVKVIK